MESFGLQSSPREQYSYKSSRFWCFNCSKEFSKLKLDNDSEILCPNCENVCEEIIDRNHHPQDFQIPDLARSNNGVGMSNQMGNQTSSSQNIRDNNGQTQATPNTQGQQQQSRSNARIYIGTRPIYRIVDFGLGYMVTREQPIFVAENDEQNQPNRVLNFMDSAFLGLNPFDLLFSNTLSGQSLDRIIEEFISNDPNRHGPPPASQQAINELKERKFNGEIGSKSCSICQDEYCQNDTILDMPCNHDFHKDCLINWLKLHNTCPVCRSRITSIEDGMPNQAK